MRTAKITVSIYGIENAVTGWWYVGQSEYPYRRYKDHLYGNGCGGVCEDAHRYGFDAMRLHILEEAVPFDSAGAYERMWFDRISKDHKMYNKVRPSWKSMPAKHAAKASVLKRLYTDEQQKAWSEIYDALIGNNIANGKKEQAKYTPTEVYNLLQTAFAL